MLKWGGAAFIERRAHLARVHHAPRGMVPREFVQLPRGSLILHASPPPNLPRFSHAYPFLTRFSRAFLEVFWCSKWVMHHIVRKLSTSTFQWYKFCTNRSLDERVMVPGSRGALTANRELHVVAGVVIFPTHLGSWVNSQRVGKTLRAKAAVWEEKHVSFPARFFLNLVPVRAYC